MRRAQALLGRGDVPIGGARLKLLYSIGRRPLVTNDLHLFACALRCAVLNTRTIGDRWPIRIPAVVVALKYFVASVGVALKLLRLVAQKASDHTPPHEAQKMPICAIPLREVIRIRDLLLGFLGIVRNSHRVALPPRLHELILATVQRLSQARSEKWIPPLILLPHPRRHPSHEHGIYQHLHKRHGPAELPALAIVHVGVELLNKILHAEKSARNASELRRAPLDRAQRIALIQPCAFQNATCLQPSPPLVGWHQTPVRDHSGAGVIAVAVTQDRRAIRRQAWRDNQNEALVVPHKLPPDLSELPPELVQRRVLHLVQSHRTGLAQKLQHEFLPLVELIQLAVPRHRRVVLGLANLLPRPKHTGTRGVQRHAVGQTENERQAQTDMHGLKDPIIAVAQRLGKNLLERLAKHVNALVIRLVFADLVHGDPKNLVQALGALRRLRRVLRDILAYGPKVHARTPIYVAQVVQENVRFMIAAKPVVPRKPRKPGTHLVALVEPHGPSTPATHQIQREAVTAHGALRLAACARMLANRRRPHLVQLVPATGLYQSCNQAADRRQIHLRTARRLEYPVQDRTQASPLGARSIHTTGDLQIVSTNLLVPEEAHLPFVIAARVPFGHQVTEVLPKHALHVTLVLHMCIVLLPVVRQRPERLRELQRTLLPFRARLGDWLRGRRHQLTLVPRLSLALRQVLIRQRRLFASHLVRVNAVVVGVRRSVVLRVRGDISANAPKARATSTNRKTMKVSVAASACLETRHAHVRFGLRRRQQRRHDDAHGQLRAQRDHVRRQVRRCAYELKAHVARVVVEGPHSLAAELCAHVQTMDIIQRVVLRIQRPPKRRDAPKSMPVYHAMLLVDEGLDIVHASARLHPRRPPRHELHSRRQLLAFVVPIHWRGTHVATHRRN